jgi:hypothetical protein
MAQDAFALSPISARATQPSEEDYDAISEAFMETARGRWFLGEYAKRNRNADTRMVLDAVERIEQGLAAQKQPVVDDRLPEALTAIKAALDQARVAASTALDDLSLEQHLAPVRKGTRVIKEISWRWREIGADGRICDLLDQQVGAIEASCGQIASIDPRSALSAAFDLIEDQIAALDEDGERPVKAATDAASPPAATDSDQTPDTTMEQAPPVIAAGDAETAVSAGAPSDEAPTEDTPPVETLVAEPGTAVTNVEASEAVAEAADAPLQAAAEPPEEAADMEEAANAHDDAVLDMVAFEMAAVDPIDFADAEIEADAADMHTADYSSAEPDTIAERCETEISAIAMPSVTASATVAADSRSSLASMFSPEVAPEAPSGPPPEPSLVQPSLVQPSSVQASLAQASPAQASPAQASLVEVSHAQPSLGSTLVASGFLRKPASGPDPLAAIRRLSQAEKVALFS